MSERNQTVEDETQAESRQTRGENSESPSVQEKLVQIKESEHKKLLDELSEQKDKYLRLFAEFDNARKRMERERQEFIKYASEDLIREFLDILDDLERTLEVAKAKHAEGDPFLKGVEMVMARLYNVLKRNNVKVMEAKGKMFDPHCHEVLMQEETNDHEEGMILEEFQKGYFMGDKVVRTAKVKVARKKHKT